MNIKINEDKKSIKIEMKDQITKLIKKFEEDSGKNVASSDTTPSMHNLFKVDISSVEFE